MSRPQAEWDARFMRLLEEPKSWSSIPGKDGGCAALLVSPDKRRTVFGYAGLPRDCSEMLTNMATHLPEHRDALCRHAERNAISNAGCDLAGFTLYVTLAPCVSCALEAHASRVARIVCPPIVQTSRWAHNQQTAAMYVRELGMQVDWFNA